MVKNVKKAAPLLTLLGCERSVFSGRFRTMTSLLWYWLRQWSRIRAIRWEARWFQAEGR
jgi:hypothetical protein